MSESKINKSLLSFPVLFQKTNEEFENEDVRFTKVRIWLMHLGQNLNGSIFEKSVVDDALHTLEYIPILGFVEENSLGEKDFSDHRYVITKDEKGVRKKYVGIPYGVIKSTEDNNAHYEERICDDGETRTFLVVDGLIWNMFEDGSDIINRDLIKSQSMELWDDGVSIEGFEDENNIFHFTKFSFRAACILGKDQEPAMINSTVEVQFTVSDFIESIQSELNDKFTTFTKMVNEKTNQGGTEVMPNTDFAQTLLAQFEDISAMVRQHETLTDVWGCEHPRYYTVDVQENEVIVVDAMNNYNYFGLSFTMNGDKAEIDFESCKRKKVRYEDYEEGSSIEGAFDFGNHIKKIEETAFSKVEDANAQIAAANAQAATAEEEKVVAETNYTQIKADYDEIKPKYDEYVMAEEQRKSEELNAQKDAKYAEYEDALADNADFAALKERKDELTVDEIEKECAVIYVKVNRTKNNFSKTNVTSAIVGVMNDSDVNDGFIQTKYGNIPVKK